MNLRANRLQAIHYTQLTLAERISASHLMGGSEVFEGEQPPSHWQRFLIITGQIIVMLYALGCYFTGAGGMALFLLSLGVAPAIALGVGFLGLVAIASGFINYRISLVGVPQALVHLFGWRYQQGQWMGTLFNVVDDDGQPIYDYQPGSNTHLRQMHWGNKLMLIVALMASVAAGAVVGGVTYGFFLSLAPTILTLLPWLSFAYAPLSIALVTSSALAMSLLAFDSWHRMINKAWFSPTGIVERIEHYLTVKLLDEILEDLQAKHPEDKGTLEQYQKAQSQYVITLILSALLIALILSGLVMTIFFASLPGLADFFATLHGVSHHPHGLWVAAWVVSSIAFIGEFSFYITNAINSADKLCQWLYRRGESKSDSGEHYFYSVAMVGDASVNALIGLKALFGLIVLGLPITAGYLGFSLFAGVGSFIASLGVAGQGRELNTRYVYANLGLSGTTEPQNTHEFSIIAPELSSTLYRPSALAASSKRLVLPAKAQMKVQSGQSDMSAR